MNLKRNATVTHAALAILLGCTITANAQTSTPPWPPKTPAAQIKSTPPTSGSNTPTVVTNPEDPDLRQMLPLNLDIMGPDKTPGDRMTTIRKFGRLVETCQVGTSQAVCSIQNASITTDNAGKKIILNWTLTTNYLDKPVMLIATSGKPSVKQGLKIIYGGNPDSNDIAENNLIGAVTSGGKIVKTDELGCQQNCVYGLLIDKTPGFQKWLDTGSGLGFTFFEHHTAISVATSLHGYKDAMAAMKMDLTRRLDPGKTGPAYIAPTATQIAKLPDKK